MPADLSKPFSESCCDGGTSQPHGSAESCGCDPGAGHVCEWHLSGQFGSSAAPGWMDSAALPQTTMPLTQRPVDNPKPYVYKGPHGTTAPFSEFVRQVEGLLDGTASGKGYNKTGADGPNELYDFVRSIAGGDGTGSQRES